MKKKDNNEADVPRPLEENEEKEKICFSCKGLGYTINRSYGPNPIGIPCSKCKSDSPTR